jgi:hypothetical protein
MPRPMALLKLTGRLRLQKDKTTKKSTKRVSFASDDESD